MPKIDVYHQWFMEAYNVLLNSCTDSGGIPLSELKVYENNFGLIGSFREFAIIIYAIDRVYIKHRNEKIKNKSEG